MRLHGHCTGAHRPPAFGKDTQRSAAAGDGCVSVYRTLDPASIRRTAGCPSFSNGWSLATVSEFPHSPRAFAAAARTVEFLSVRAHSSKERVWSSGCSAKLKAAIDRPGNASFFDPSTFLIASSAAVIPMEEI